MFYETTSRSTSSLVNCPPQPTSHFDPCICQLYYITNIKEIQQGNCLHHHVPLILSTPKLEYFLLSKFEFFSLIICEDLRALPEGKKYRLTLQIIADNCMLSDILLPEETCELRYLSNISQSHWSCSTRGRADIEGRLSFRSNMSSSYGSLSIITTKTIVIISEQAFKAINEFLRYLV